ncbi:MAG: HAMP domain-containing histidine kinase [Betaproteobacteria bacterium]|nr:HAMP domain-containing histidine kinase [Betaproteobacteria bacterium]
MIFIDRSLTPLTAGDARLNADSIRLTIKDGDVRQTWWLTFQTKAHVLPGTNFEITAFKSDPSGAIERDRRIEGWAYVQQQSPGVQAVTITARMDYRAIVPSVNDKEMRRSWPPEGWDKLQLSLSRKDVNEGDTQQHMIDYKGEGSPSLSIIQRSAPIFLAHAKLTIKQQPPAETKEWLIVPPPSITNASGTDDAWDWVLGWSPIVKTQPLANTLIAFQVEHPGTVVEKGVWQTALLLFILIIAFLCLAVYAFLRVLKPIWTMSRISRQLVVEVKPTTLVTAINTDDSKLSLSELIRRAIVNKISGYLTAAADKLTFVRDLAPGELPYSDRTDEIGALSQSFNALLESIRREASIKKEEVRVREIALKVIRHEVRNGLSDLAAISSKFPDDTSAKQIIQRITLFFSKLEEGLENVRIDLESTDIASFVSTVVRHVSLKEQNVRYDGPQSGIFCVVDKSLLEQAITNILTNALERRNGGSTIDVSVTPAESVVTIAIKNDGPQIPSEHSEKLFDPFFSYPEPKRDEIRGIGLWGCRAYISKMSGDVTFSNTSTGVVFRISLPLLRDVSKKASP